MGESAGRPELHTDLLERLYSEVSVKLESQTDMERRAHLIDRLGISRTYAITRFHTWNWSEEVRSIAIEIQNGKSIGKTFRSHNYAIKKEMIRMHETNLPAMLRKKFHTTESRSLLSEYMFTISKDGKSFVNFARIVEIYPPDVSREIVK